jgi:hypothetical protein
VLTERIVKEKVNQVLNNNPLREIDGGDDLKTDGGTVCRQILVNGKLQIGKRGQRVH